MGRSPVGRRRNSRELFGLICHTHVQGSAPRVKLGGACGSLGHAADYPAESQEVPMARFCWSPLWEPMPTRPKHTLGSYVLGRARGEGWRDRRHRSSRWTRHPPDKLLCAFTQIGRWEGVTFSPRIVGWCPPAPWPCHSPSPFLPSLVPSSVASFQACGGTTCWGCGSVAEDGECFNLPCSHSSPSERKA